MATLETAFFLFSYFCLLYLKVLLKAAILPNRSLNFAALRKEQKKGESITEEKTGFFVLLLAKWQHYRVRHMFWPTLPIFKNRKAGQNICRTLYATGPYSNQYIKPSFNNFPLVLRFIELKIGQSKITSLNVKDYRSMNIAFRGNSNIT